MRFVKMDESQVDELLVIWIGYWKRYSFGEVKQYNYIRYWKNVVECELEKFRWWFLIKMFDNWNNFN